MTAMTDVTFGITQVKRKNRINYKMFNKFTEKLYTTNNDTNFYALPSLPISFTFWNFRTISRITSCSIPHIEELILVHIFQ